MYHDTKRLPNGQTPRSTGRSTFQRSLQDFILSFLMRVSKNMLPTHSESDGPIHLNIGFVFAPFYLVLVSKSLSISLALTFFFLSPKVSAQHASVYIVNILSWP